MKVNLIRKKKFRTEKRISSNLVKRLLPRIRKKKNQITDDIFFVCWVCEQDVSPVKETSIAFIKYEADEMKSKLNRSTEKMLMLPFSLSLSLFFFSFFFYYFKLLRQIGLSRFKR